MPTDLSSAAAALETYLRMIGSVEPVDVVTSFTGSVTAMAPGRKPENLFRVEGFSVGRAERTRNGFRWLSREVLIFFDSRSGAPLIRFEHPLIDRSVEVAYVWNDPRNELLSADAFLLRPQINEGMVTFCRETLPFVTNPLVPGRWPRESSGDMLSIVDLRRFVSTQCDIEGTAPSVGCETTWTMVTPWLPWMLLGATPGYLVWHLGGTKRRGGYGSLSVRIRSIVESERPEFAFAPRDYAESESIWSNYEKERRPIP